MGNNHIIIKLLRESISQKNDIYQVCILIAD